MRRHEGIQNQAIDWLVRRNAREWSAEEQSQLDEWLEESMAHKAAFWRAVHLWQQTDRIRSLGYDANARTADRGIRRNFWPMAIAASLIAALGIGGLSVAPMIADQRDGQVQQARFDTPVGGHRIVPLIDGSKIELNTRTALRVDVDRQNRQIWLDDGEAFFEVAHREGRPFVVHAGRQTVTVLGTKFSVRRDGERVTVNVAEGRVKVDDRDGKTAHVAIITAGETAISRESSTLITARSEERVASALAWREGRLSFDQAPLSDVVSEFNRYNRRQLVVADVATGQIPIGGSFQASNADAFTRLLRDAYGLNVDRRVNETSISSQ